MTDLTPPAVTRTPAAGGGEDGLSFDAISHAYGTASGPMQVLEDVTFAVGAGEVACVIGPSGCGKSTLLGLAAGLMAPSAGETRWRGAPVRKGANPDLGMVFQQPGLFPWMTVRRNVEIGLRTRGATRAEARQRADGMLETVGLAAFADAYPSQLSGGMAQRVGIARALALRPSLLLMDEPFASVDAFTRLKLQAELKALLARLRPTVVFVTHDVSEAILLGDRIIVMSPRPARVQTVIPVVAGDRDRAGPGYVAKMTWALRELGVETDLSAVGASGGNP